jgi:formate hydrogenlyase subunit 6/NADH:ubiquinone oxidoreductase subunit I
MSRRNALKKLVSSAALLASGTAPFAISYLMTPTLATEYSKHLRPPGALENDDEFVAACIGCGLCGEICPPKCIQFHKRDGGSQVNTPYINPEDKACILCNKCMEVCPTEALKVVKRNEVDMGIAQIDRTACYPWVDRGICGACVAVCPLGEKAIKFKHWHQYQPIVQKACVGCGLCVEVCPHPSLPIKIVERSKGSVTGHTIT